MDKLISPRPHPEALPKAQGPLGQAAAMFFKNRGAVIGLALLIIIVMVSLVGPILLPADPFDVAGAPMTPPLEDGHWLGTDYVGRDLFMGVEIATGEIVRDENGLALSSRNKYLDKMERLGASRLHAALEDGRRLCIEGCSNVDRIKAHVINKVTNAKTRVIYVEIVDAETSLPMLEAVPGKSRISAAIWYGQTRLIDNIRI